MTRPKFATRTIDLDCEDQVRKVMAQLPHLPIDAKKPIQVVIREKATIRNPDQNSLYHAGPLKDIAEQAWLEKRKFSADVWHFFLKKEFLPEEAEEGITKEGYVKWDFDPLGDKVLVGSTTQLTVKGFSIYLEQVCAFGANLGVQFHANPNQI